MYFTTVLLPKLSFDDLQENIATRIVAQARLRQNGGPQERSAQSNNRACRCRPSASPHVHQSPPGTADASLLLRVTTRLHEDHSHRLHHERRADIASACRLE